MEDRSAFVLVSIASLIGILVCSDDCVAADNPYPCYEPLQWTRITPGDSCPPESGSFHYDGGLEPLPGHRPQPAYPEIESGEEEDSLRGPVELAVCVGRNGKVLKWRVVIGGLPPRYQKAVDDVMPLWRFSPAICDGHPVIGRTMVTITFNPSRSSREESAARRKLADQSAQDQISPSSQGDPCPVDGFLLPDEDLPKPLPGHQPAPEYPDYMEPKVGGWVTVSICVDKDGVVRQWDVFPDLAPEFQQEIDLVMPYWRFSPATYYGHPVGARTSIRFYFTPPPTPPDTTPDGLVKASLRKCDPKVQISKKKRQGWVLVSVRGQLRSDCPRSALETTYCFLDLYREFFALSDPRSEVAFVPYDSRPFSHHEDSTLSNTRGGQEVNYRFVQFHAGVPVLGSSVDATVVTEGPTLTAISAMLLPDICVNNPLKLTEQDALEAVQPLLSGPDRHCTADEPRLWATRIDAMDYFIWIINLSCSPVVGFGWGEQVWVDAHSGEILKKMGTWIE